MTSFRICYVDNAEPRKHSVGIDLKEVERYEFYAGFFSSSPKITLIPKPSKRSSLQNKNLSSINTQTGSTTSSPTSRTDSPFHLPPAEALPATDATWVCTICSLSNPVPSNFDPATANVHTPLAPCLACGIKPQLTHVLKAAITSTTSRAQPSSTSLQNPVPIRPQESCLSSSAVAPLDTNGTINGNSLQCPRCTFLNHSSLTSCELCGASLLLQALPASIGAAAAASRSESPGPVLQNQFDAGQGALENIKLSFRDGGEKIFNERLKGALTQRKWLLSNARPPPRPGQHTNGTDGGVETANERVKTVGIAGLEQRRNDVRDNNAVVIGGAFEDLEALMTSAKEIIALAESFARQTNSNIGGSSEENTLLAQSASALGLVTTKDMLGGGSASDTLYLSELSRNLAEFLTDDSRGILRKAGGIMTLVDLWAIFNRARGGVELVSPSDFEKAALLWEKLKLPIRLRKFKSGVLVVQASDRTDEKTIKALLNWMSSLHTIPPDEELPWAWQEFGRGITVREASERFGWSIGVATEELEMAEESGALCREESIEGLKYWENWIGCIEPSKESVEEEFIVQQLREAGLM